MEVWRSDGTAEGTQMVDDIATGEAWSDPKRLTDLNGLLMFSANNGTCGRELWAAAGPVSGRSVGLDIERAHILVFQVCSARFSVSGM
jgi:ELWxxDGT repeat protein